MDPISWLQAAILGLLRGVSELFPISSLGHSVILRRPLGWNIHQNDDYGFRHPVPRDTDAKRHAVLPRQGG